MDPTLLHRVSLAVDHVVRTAVMPSFRALRPEDIRMKDTPGDPEDLVTIADKAAELLLVERLGGIVPGAAFVGEEAVSDDPSLLDALDAPAPAWLIDPIDGTKNFAKGDPSFGVMLALVERGLTQASWMAVPAAAAEPFTVTASRGGGTWIGGARIRTAEPGARPRGTIHSRMAPPDDVRLLDRLRDRYAPIPSSGASATEYSSVVRGEKDFVIYYRLLPWDHAPGALALEEAGGAAIHLDGSPYSPMSGNQITIFAATPRLAQALRRWALDLQ